MSQTPWGFGELKSSESQSRISVQTAFEREGAIATRATVRKGLVPCEIDLSTSFLILIPTHPLLTLNVFSLYSK